MNREGGKEEEIREEKRNMFASVNRSVLLRDLKKAEIICDILGVDFEKIKEKATEDGLDSSIIEEFARDYANKEPDEEMMGEVAHDLTMILIRSVCESDEDAEELAHILHQVHDKHNRHK